MKNFLIYGSYGYTGQLIVEHATGQGLRPILGGRDDGQLRAKAERYKLEYRAFSLDENSKLEAALREVDAVLHCAGPFVHTYRQMAEACLRMKRHIMWISAAGSLASKHWLAWLPRQKRQASCSSQVVESMW